MTGLDIEGVLAGHRSLIHVGLASPRWPRPPACTCGWEDGFVPDAMEAHRAHVAAVLREQIATAQAEAWDEALFAVCVDNGIVYDIGMRPLNPYRAAQVAPSRVPGEET